jgi:pimeloyl-ACP methyl ester carboxylesterase
MIESQRMRRDVINATTVVSSAAALALALAFVVACGSSSTATPADGDAGGPGPTSSSGGDSGGGANDGSTTSSGGDGSAPPPDGSTSGAHDYGQDGAFTVSTKSESASNGTSSFTVMTYLPSGKGPFPVVVLSSGLQQPGAGYAPYAKRLASWGIAAILRDDPGFGASSASVQADLEGLVKTWLPTADSGAFDASKVGLAGHSRGGQVSLLAAENGLLGKNKGLFLLDPVDSSNGGSSARAKIGMLAVPLAMIGETTDATGGVGGMACAPAADNYEVLYAAAASPALAITAVGGDHVMFEDPASCSFCNFCTAGTADASKVLATSVRLMTTFFAKQLLGDASIDAKLGTAADVAAGTLTVESK